MSFYNPSDYDPSKEGGGRAQPGEYSFRIDVAEETTFRSGNGGMKITLLVGAFPDRDVKVFDRLVAVPGALWKVKQLCDAVGLDFNRAPEAREFEGRTGRARFIKGEKGYLEVDEYLARGANNSQSVHQQRKPAQQARRDYEPPPHTDDDLPF